MYLIKEGVTKLVFCSSSMNFQFAWKTENFKLNTNMAVLIHTMFQINCIDDKFVVWQDCNEVYDTNIFIS